MRFVHNLILALTPPLIGIAIGFGGRTLIEYGYHTAAILWFSVAFAGALAWLLHSFPVERKP